MKSNLNTWYLHRPKLDVIVMKWMDLKQVDCENQAPSP